MTKPPINVSKNIKIRKATITDVENLQRLRMELAKIYLRVYGISTEEEDKKGLEYYHRLQEYEKKNNGVILLALDGDKVIGMGEVEPTDNSLVACAGSLGVLPHYRGMGIGMLIHIRLIEWVKLETNYAFLQGYLVKTNDKLLAFFELLGLRIVGEGSYQGIPEWNLEMKIARE